MVCLMVLIGCRTAAAQLVIVRNNSFTSSYNLRLLVPQQVEWKLYSTDIGQVKREPNWHFNNDLKTPWAVARHADYTNSGYDRGHMCPAADRSSDVSYMRETFVMSNIAPQTPHLNRVTWLDTEKKIRTAAMTYDSIGVVAVPVFLDRDTTYIGRHRVAVPHGFFKAAWKLDNDSVIFSWFVFNE